jgi:hypothetical protein
VRNLELGVLFRQLVQGSGVILILATVLMLVLEPWRPVLLGFALGAALSILNGWLLVNSIQKLVAFVLQESREFAQVLYIMGMVIRWLALFAVLVYIGWSGLCNLLGLLAGFFVLPLLAVAKVIYILLSPRVDSKYS